MTPAQYDEMGLGELIDLAHSEGVSFYQPFTKWLEDYYDPAKSALIELIEWKASL